MKKMMFMAMMMTIAISASAMTYGQARQEALFLTDKMSYELGLNIQQADAVYEVNLDYLMHVDRRADISGTAWQLRNRDLRDILTASQYARYMAASYFYRPLAWKAGTWHFAIYDRYVDRSRFLASRPRTYLTYRGATHPATARPYAGRSFGSMAQRAPQSQPVAKATPTATRRTAPAASRPSASRQLSGTFGARR